MKLSSLSWVGLVGLFSIPMYAAEPSTDSNVPPAPSVQSSPATNAPLIITGGPLSPNAAQVAKLAGANVGDDVLLAYVKNSQSTFNLSADAIVRLKDSGVTSPVISAMLAHDTELQNQAAAQAQAQPQNPAPVYSATQPPAEQQQVVTPPLVPNDQAPPTAPVEVIPTAPGPDYYWTPGYWGWNGGWLWIGGSWGLHPWWWGGHYYGHGWYGGYGHGGYGGYGHGGWGGHYGGGIHASGGFHGGNGGFHGSFGAHGGGSHR